MYNGILSLDHPLIAVADMQQSKQVYEKLGFTIPPRGSHIEWGTGNWCIMFANDYLELRGILDPSRETLGLEHVLEQYGEGLAGIAFGTEGAEISHAKMSQNQLHPKPVRYLTRNFEVPGQWLQPKFALCFPADTETQGLTHVVLCDHLTPELMRKPEYLHHDNDAQGIISMTGVIDDIDQVEQAQRRLLGPDAVQRVGEHLILTLATGQFIRLCTKDSLAEEYSGLSHKSIQQQSYLIALKIAVGDIQKTKLSLEKNLIPYVQPNPYLVQVADHYACGVVFEFEQRPTTHSSV
jgi:hypothetical protein